MFFPSRLARRGANPRAKVDPEIKSRLVELARTGAALFAEAKKVQDQIKSIIEDPAIEYEDFNSLELELEGIWAECGTL